VKFIVLSFQFLMGPMLDMIRIVITDYTIGLDLGGTNLRAAAIDASGTMIAKVAGHTNLSEGREVVVTDMVRAIRTLRDQLGRTSLSGIGVVVPGFMNLDEGVIVNSNNLATLEGFPFRDRLEESLETPVVLENDANAAALGEKWMGAGRDVKDLVLLTLGTGIGGGIISGGKVLHGYMGMAGELGHITVVPNGNPCGCGNRGCLEKHASAQAISVMARLSGLGDITSEECFHLAENGNEKAQMVFLSMGEALGLALATLINIFNFPLYLVGGGAVAAWDQFAPHMFAEIRRRSLTFRATQTRIEKATLGSEAGLFGAAYLPRMNPAPVRA
jgi:glucokinase